MVPPPSTTYAGASFPIGRPSATRGSRARPRWAPAPWAVSAVLHGLAVALLVPVALDLPTRPVVQALHLTFEESSIPDPPAEDAPPLDEEILEAAPQPTAATPVPWEPRLEPHEDDAPEELPEAPEPRDPVARDMATPALDELTSPLRPRRRDSTPVTAPPPLPSPQETPPALRPPASRPVPAPEPAPRPSRSRSVPRQAWAPSPTSYYPEPARREGVEGTVRIGLDIAASGAVQRAWVIVSSGDPRLDAAARDLGLAVRFHPMSSAAIGELTVRFRLEG